MLLQNNPAINGRFGGHPAQLRRSGPGQFSDASRDVHLPLQQCSGDLNPALQKEAGQLLALQSFPDPFPGLMRFPVVGEVVKIHSVEVIRVGSPAVGIEGAWRFFLKAVKVSPGITAWVGRHARHMPVGRKRLRGVAPSPGPKRRGPADPGASFRSFHSRKNSTTEHTERTDLQNPREKCVIRALRMLCGCIVRRP